MHSLHRSLFLIISLGKWKELVLTRNPILECKLTGTGLIFFCLFIELLYTSMLTQYKCKNKIKPVVVMSGSELSVNSLPVMTCTL